jgi:riboflavin biosynthesis pyrimidine reductase
VYPELAPAFAEWRRSLGLEADPRLVVLTRSGDLDPAMPALRDALVLTTEAGAAVVRDRAVPAEVEVLGERTVDVTDAVTTLRARGSGALLTEGGPHVLGEFLRAELLDELFLTLSPTLAGRDGPGRLGLVEGVTFDPDALGMASLLSLKTNGSHLFLRYAIRRPDGD